MKRILATGWLAAGLCISMSGAAAAAAGPALAAGPFETRLSQQLGFQPVVTQSGPDCSGGIRYDDGGFEDATSVPRADGLQVMSFDLPANASGVAQVCVALTRSSTSTSQDLDFNVVFYAADGPAGSPGTLLASVPGTATAIPITSTNTVNAQFYAVGIGSALTLPASRTLYVGLQFDGSQGFFIGVDQSSTTPYRSAFASIDGGVDWQSEADVNTFYRAFGIRVDPTIAATNCVPSTTAMCLQADRFRVEATFQTKDGIAGSAEAVRLTPDSGYLWFFASSNIEEVVKVLDACALNKHFWVFAGGLTNVFTTLTVTDTQTGAFRIYKNPQGTPFQPLQDTSALPCP
jgi:hypothetical protein